MKELISMLLVMFFVTNTFSNHKILHDKLIWKGDTINIEIFPLEYYIDHVKKIDTDSIFGKEFVKPQCWNCMKGYVAEWAIIAGKLYLTNIYSHRFKSDSLKADLKSLFPDRFKDDKVIADWFNGEIYVPKGSSIFLDYGDYQVFESEFTLSFNSGNLIDTRFREKNYYLSVFTKDTDSLRKFVIHHVNMKNIPKLRKKEPSYLQIKTGQNKYDFKATVRTDNDSIRNELLRIAKLIPEFSYYYWHGKALQPTFALRIRFSE